jgi:hypothetical protein
MQEDKIKIRGDVASKSTRPLKAIRSQKDHASGNLSQAPDPLAQVSCRIGDSSCARAQASKLNRVANSRIIRAKKSLLQLQKDYGNRYVQHVLSLSRKGRSEVAVGDDVEQAIHAARGGGQPLDRGVRAQMESAFNTDFSGVRVHADAGADRLNKSLNARAFTNRKDIFFREGAYQPGSSSGRELLAHELTHVVQQNAEEIQTKLTVGRSGDHYEQEADQVAKAVISKEHEVPPQEKVGTEIRRQEEEEELQAQPLEEEEEEIQTQPEEEEEEVIQT